MKVSCRFELNILTDEERLQYETIDLNPRPRIQCPGVDCGDAEIAIAQTWERKEIIVVDDGSTDQTLTIARQFVSKGVSVLHPRKSGSCRG